MVHIRSPYSSITQSTIQYVDEVATQADKDNATLTVLIPQFVPKNHGKIYFTTRRVYD